MDYTLTLQMVSAYLLWANELLYWKKNIFDVALIPAGHPMYTGMLKSTGYRLLKPCKTIFVVWKWIWKNISVFAGEYPVYMWKKWKISKWSSEILQKSKNIKIENNLFDWCSFEYQFLRIISDYSEVVFVEIWDNVSKISAVNLLAKLSKLWNILFISDLHSGYPLEECIDLDEDIYSPWVLDNDSQMFLVDVFCKLMKKLHKKPETIWYINSWDITDNKKSTTWYCSIVF